MKLGFKRGEKGFTLIEIIIVLAVLGILAAIVVPNVQGFLGQGKDRSWRADRDILQAATDAWRTDITNRAGNKWPTIGSQSGSIGGTIGSPADVNNDGKFDDSTDNNTFIDIAELADENYIRGADVVKSAFVDATNIVTTNTNSPSGSYAWYIDSSGLVQSWYTGNDTLGSANITIDSSELGFQTDVYP